MGEWAETTLSEIAALKNGKGLKNTLYCDNGTYPVWGANGQIARTNELLNDESVVVIGRVGAYCGSVHAAFGPNWVTDNAIVATPQEGNDFRFLYYLLRSLNLERAATGSAQPLVTQSGLNILRCLRPPLSEQKAIAHILGTLDDKIELNRRMNETLEGIARAIFKSWFIDFDPAIDNALRAGNPIPDSMAERAEVRRRLLDQNQPSPPAPLPEVEGRKNGNYRGGYDFSGLVEKARELRKTQTETEDLFWELVRNRGFLGSKFRRQHQLGDYIADFYCHEHRLVIELDGGVHDAKQKKDHKRDAWMQAQGYTVLRFKNAELIDAPESVLNQIAATLPLPLGEGRGEGVMGCGAFQHLFPDGFEDSELGEIPRGWTVGVVGDIATQAIGGQWGQDSPAPGFVAAICLRGCDMEDLRRHGFASNAPVRYVKANAIEKRLPKEGDLLVAASGAGPCGRPLWCAPAIRGIYREPVIYSNFVKRFTTPGPEYAVYLDRILHGKFQDRTIEDFITGTSVPNLDAKGLLQSCPILLPSSHVLDIYYRQCLHVFSKLYAPENVALADLRGRLLPGLLSGDIPVPEVEEAVA